MNKRSATQSSAHREDGLNVRQPDEQMFAEQVAEALAEWPQHDEKQLQNLVQKIMVQLDSDPQGS